MMTATGKQTDDINGLSMNTQFQNVNCMAKKNCTDVPLHVLFAITLHAACSKQLSVQNTFYSLFFIENILGSR